MGPPFVASFAGSHWETGRQKAGLVPRGSDVLLALAREICRPPHRQGGLLPDDLHAVLPSLQGAPTSCLPPYSSLSAPCQCNKHRDSPTTRLGIGPPHLNPPPPPPPPHAGRCWDRCIAKGHGRNDPGRGCTKGLRGASCHHLHVSKRFMCRLPSFSFLPSLLSSPFSL